MTIEFVLVSYDRAWPPKASPHALDLHLYGEGIFWMNRVHKLQPLRVSDCGALLATFQTADHPHMP